MDKSKKKITRKRKRRFKWMPQWIYIILAASMIGFTNAYYDEYRWINNSRNFIQYEQIFNDEDKYKKKKNLNWERIKKKRTPDTV
jgi:hypothetical protein